MRVGGVDDIQGVLDGPLRIARKLRTGETDTYRLTTIYYFADRYGRFHGSLSYEAHCDRTITQVAGESYRERCVWHDVSVMKQTGDEPPQPRERLDYAEQFVYEYDASVTVPTFAFSQVDFFPIPQDVRHYHFAVMIMDLHSFDLELMMAGMLQLRMGERRRATFAELAIPVGFGRAVTGTFTNGPTHVTYLGVSRYQEEICYLVEGSSINNPLDLTLDDGDVRRVQKGTSSYVVKVLGSVEQGKAVSGSLFECVPLVETVPTVPGDFGILEATYVVWRELFYEKVPTGRSRPDDAAPR